MAKFKKGDRVVFISDSKCGVFPPQFTRGTVDGHVYDDPEYMFVWWDVRPTGFPNTRTACPEKYAILASEYKPERAPTRSIHISTDADGKTIHAVMKQGDKVVRREKAVCAPSDTYDFETGATVAFGRLFGKDQNKPEAKPTYREVKREFKVGDKAIVTGKDVGCHRLAVGSVAIIVKTVYEDMYKVVGVSRCNGGQITQVLQCDQLKPYEG